MKVLLVNKFHYMKGGSERYYFTLAELLRSHGHEVSFFAMQDENNIPCPQEKYFVSNASVGGGLKSKLNMILHIAYSKEAYKKMTALLNAETPDLVILNLVHKQITCSVIDAIKDFDKNIPIFWTMHDLIAVCPSYTMLDGENKICEKCLDGDFNHCIENRCIKGSKLMSILSAYEAKTIRKKGWYNQVDLFICPSEFYQRKLQKAHFTKAPVVCIRNPLAADTKYEVNTQDKGYILYFGRLAREKGVKTLMEAMGGMSVPLYILGTGPTEEELKKYAVEKQLDNVSFKGFQQGEALTDYVRNARCVVLPSEWYENGPYSAMEAMSFGKPLIVSSYGGLPELVEEGKNGFVFRNAEELKAAIERMIALPSSEYEELCNNSCEMAKAMFDGNGYVDQIARYYRKIKEGEQI